MIRFERVLGFKNILTTKVEEQAGVPGICQIIAVTSEAPEEFDSFIKDSLTRKGRHTNLNANQEA